MQSDDVITAVVLVALLGAAVWKLPWGKLQMLSVVEIAGPSEIRG